MNRMTTDAFRNPENVQAITLSSGDLFQGKQILTIEHEGMIYTLRITRQGKLLLTK